MIAKTATKKMKTRLVGTRNEGDGDMMQIQIQGDVTNERRIRKDTRRSTVERKPNTDRITYIPLREHLVVIRCHFVGRLKQLAIGQQ